MSNFNFQGDANLLSVKQIKFLCELLEEHGFDGGKVIIADLGEVGDNYGSNVKTITVEREDGKTFKMVAKIAPTSEFTRTTMNTEIMFRNESLMYSEVLPKFRQIEIAADIPEEHRFRFPICYGILNEELHEIILLEDLRQSDYIMKDRLKSLTDKEIRIILDSFAKLHSYSFVLKKQDLAAYEDLTSKLTDFFTSPQMTKSAKTNFTMLEEHILTLFDDDRYKNKIKGSLSDILIEMNKLRKCDFGSKYSVIIHGDSWTNNILLKLNGDVPEESMLIDYQLSTERAPVSDFLYLIMNCTDFDTRSKYYNSWVDDYHDKLDKYLSHHGLKANFVYSKEKMLADLKRYSKFFLGWSIMLSNVLCMDTKLASRFRDSLETSENSEEIMDSMKNDSVGSESEALLKAKVKGIIESYYELGYCS